MNTISTIYSNFNVDYDPTQIITSKVYSHLSSLRKYASGIPVQLNRYSWDSIINCLSSLGITLSPLDIDINVLTDKGYIINGGFTFTYKDVKCVIAVILNDDLDHVSPLLISDSSETTSEIISHFEEFYRKESCTIIHLYTNGSWKNEERPVFNWDDLYLDENTKSSIVTDCDFFFSPKGRKLYSDLKIPYKRGILLCGPPGSGKTLVGRIISSQYKVPCIYVTNFSHPFYGPNTSIEDIFQKANQLGSCVILFEDLDTIIDASTRSNFLNKIDGINPLDGIMFIGTTNHPENIDSALIERPSRFDQKFVFSYPTQEIKLQYLQDKCKLVTDLTDDIVEECRYISENTSSMLLSHIKEILLSASIVSKSKDLPFSSCLRDSLTRIKNQFCIKEGVTLDDLSNSGTRLGFKK